MNKNPAISVILPVYNAEAYVREAVESILAQTFTDFECIIINDGSTDGSEAILRELAAHDTRIVLVERPNDGLVSALNEGIGRARAGLIARMDADDVAMPERFALQYARMVQEPELAVLGSSIRVIDKVGNIIRLLERPLTRQTLIKCMENTVKSDIYNWVYTVCIRADHKINYALESASLILVCRILIKKNLAP